MKTPWFLLGLLLPFCATAMRCMNFYGLETESKDLVCSWKHAPWWYLSRLQAGSMAIDTIRVPFSHQYVQEGNFTNLDALMVDSQRLGFRVMLDYHRTFSTHQSPHPDAEISLLDFFNTWTTIVDRYVAYSSLFALDLFNEPQDVDFTYMNDFHYKMVQMLELRYPKRFTYILDCPVWGSDCRNIDLMIPGIEPSRIKLGIHLYPFTSTETSLDSIFNKNVPSNRWIVTETGYMANDRQHVEWFTSFLQYIKKRNITDVCLWTIAHSVDTGGWWNDDCETYNDKKNQIMQNLWPKGSIGGRHFNRLAIDNPHMVNITESGTKAHLRGKRFVCNNETIDNDSLIPCSDR